MIVQCDQCQTRFKIPDEKVTEKGVKVRCTKCQHTFRVSRPAAAAPPPPPPADDPFSFANSLGAAAAPPPDPFDDLDAPTRVGTMSPDLLAALRGPDPSAAVAGPRPPTAESFVATTPRVPVVAPPTARAVATPAPPVFDPFANDPDPFGLEAAATQQHTAPSRSPSLTPVPSRSASHTPAPMRSASAAVAMADPFAPSDPFGGDSMDSDPFSLSPPASPNALRTPPPMNPFGADEQTQQATAQTSVSSLFDSSFPSEDSSHSQSASSEPDVRSLFDIPDKPARATPPPTFETAPAPEPAPRPVAAPSVPLGAVRLKAKTRAEPEVEAPPPGRTGRTVVAAILNLAIAAVLVVALFAALSAYISGGRIDGSTFSVERVKSLFAARSELVAVDVSNGLYVTREGREIFFVRGEAENRGETARRLRVQVEVLDGNQRVKLASTLAGVSATPEQLHEVTTSEQMEALRKQLDEKSVEVAPGAKVPFVVPFFDYPPDLASYQLRVTILPEDSKTAGR